MLIQLIYCLYKFQISIYGKLALKDLYYNLIYNKFLKIIKKAFKDFYHSLKFRKILKKGLAKMNDKLNAFLYYITNNFY
jgi:hypothetical protein